MNLSTISKNIAYETEIDSVGISEGRMQFIVTHRRPKYSKNDKDEIMVEIGGKLHDIFWKYQSPSQSYINSVSVSA